VRAGHAVAHDGQDAAAVIDLDAVDLSFAQFGVERTTHDTLGTFGFGFRHREADRMLGAALRNKDDRNAFLAQCTEQAVRGAGHADHAGTFEVHERDAVDRRDALHQRVGIRAVVNQGAGFVGCERVLDPDRDAFLHRGRHRRRVDDLRAKVREFHRLVVRERVDHLRLRHEARVGAQHAVHVGPDHDLERIEQRAEDRRRVVAAVATQRRLQALRVGRDEAGHHQRADEFRRHQRGRLRPGLIPAHARPHRAPLHQQRLAGVEPLHVSRRTAAQQALEQARRPDFAIAGDEVTHRG
jgi:hypothetical protein